MVAGSIIKRIRELRHLDTTSVAEATGISHGRLIDFESDAREPSFLQLEKLAEVYGVPPYRLAGEETPNLPEVVTDFRLAQPSPARVSPQGMKRLWFASHRSEFAAQLASQVEWTKPKWVGDVPSGSVDLAHAANLRRYFDIWRNSRPNSFEFVGADEQVFLQSFRIFMEMQGLVISINDAPPTDYLGFYLRPSEGLPCAFINRKISSKKAQLFTLVHETAHHLLRLEGLSNPFIAKNDIERQCNQFAAEFLAPLGPFMKAFEGPARANRGGDLFGLVNFVSQRSLLSRHAAAIRLAEAQLIAQSQLNSWIASQVVGSRDEKDEEDTAGGGAVHAKRVGEIGYLPTYVAAIAVQRGIADSLDIRNGLSFAESLQSSAFDLTKRRVATACAP